MNNTYIPLCQFYVTNYPCWVDYCADIKCPRKAVFLLQCGIVPEDKYKELRAKIVKARQRYKVRDKQKGPTNTYSHNYIIELLDCFLETD